MNYQHKYNKYKYRYLNLKFNINQFGNGLDCEAEGFNKKIREATVGKEYLDAIVNHENGEMTTYDELVDISLRGMIKWYCEQAKLSDEEYKKIINMDEIKILGAFYHRYKVIIEHYNHTLDLMKTLNNKNIDEYLKNIKLNQNNIINNINKFKSYIKDGQNYDILTQIDIPMQTIIEKVQCLLWIIVKYKKLPDNFTMDDRIKNRAYNIIDLKCGLSYPTRLDNFKTKKFSICINC
jgi:hypothetical protein